MKIYRVHFSSKEQDDNGESTGYEYFASAKAAKKAMHDVRKHKKCEWYQIEVDASRDGIIRALNIYGGHPDNG